LVKVPIVVISEEDDGAIRPWQGTTDLLRNPIPVPQATGVVGFHLQPASSQHIVASTLEEDETVQRREEEGCIRMAGQTPCVAQL
jgi:hypothetical protein